MAVATRRDVAVILFSMFALWACDGSRDASSYEPAGPELAVRSPGCDFGRMSQDARSYFPGSGRGSVSSDVQALIDQMEAACAANDDDAYTTAWFQVSAILGDVLSAGTGGDPADGVSFLDQSITVLRPDASGPIFDPCDGLTDCRSWDGYDDGVLPDFASVLGSPQGAWAVVSQGNEAVCSGFQRPCPTWSSGDPDTWGVEPLPTWEDALWSRESVLFGYPLYTDSPTGEAQFGVTLPAYQWLLIPYPKEFGSKTTNPDGQLLVSLCSDGAASVGQLMVQKGSTILTESAASSWCGLTTQQADNGSLLHRLAAFLSPVPAPLNAVLAFGPGAGGLASSFTDFYGVDIPNSAVLAIPSQPADGYVGQAITSVDGAPFRVIAYTSSEQSPLEKATVNMQVIGNAGLVASDNDVSASTLTCDGFDCTGQTLGDEYGSDAGTLFLPLEITKTGQYSLCFTAELPPLQFGAPVCTVKFNIRP